MIAVTKDNEAQFLQADLTFTKGLAYGLQVALDVARASGAGYATLATLQRELAERETMVEDLRADLLALEAKI